MTRDEFAKAMGIDPAHLPMKPRCRDVTWQQVYDNSCPDCKAYSARGGFPILHHDECPQQVRGYYEGLKEILALVKKAENAVQTDYEEKE